MISYIALAIAIFFTTFVATNADPCDCHPVQSWDDLRSLIMSNTNLEKQNVQVDLPLCPFSIAKNHNEDTIHWKEIIYIPSPIHLYCKKEDPSDICAITITGDKCRKNQNCGRQLFKIMADDVWLQGLTINHAKDLVVNVDKNVKNAKLIDMKFVGGFVPDNDTAISAGVILGEVNSNIEVLRSTFKWNQATPIYSRGSLVVYDSTFIGNRGTKFLKRGGAIFTTGEAVITKSSFLYNWGGPGGLAIWTNNENTMDAGGNCFKGRGQAGCPGINLREECFPFVGENTVCVE